jgi:hypothetical protein
LQKQHCQLVLQGVLINRGWEVEGAADNAVVARLAKLPLPQLCPAGFVFAWADKAHVRPPATCPALAFLGCYATAQALPEHQGHPFVRVHASSVCSTNPV